LKIKRRRSAFLPALREEKRHAKDKDASNKSLDVSGKHTQVGIQNNVAVYRSRQLGRSAASLFSHQILLSTKFPNKTL